jgi:DICT domain-containing protein
MTAKMADTAAAAAIGAATRELRLPVVRTDAARLAEIAQRSQQSYLAFLAEVLSAEVDERSERRRQRRVTEARFPR